MNKTEYTDKVLKRILDFGRNVHRFDDNAFDDYEMLNLIDDLLNYTEDYTGEKLGEWMDKRFIVKVINQQDEIDRIYNEKLNRLAKVSKDVYKYLNKNYNDLEMIDLLLLGIDLFQFAINQIFDEDTVMAFTEKINNAIEELFGGKNEQWSDEKMSIILMNILFGILDILIITGILLGIRRHFKVVKWKRNI